MNRRFCPKGATPAQQMIPILRLWRRRGRDCRPRSRRASWRWSKPAGRGGHEKARPRRYPYTPCDSARKRSHAHRGQVHWRGAAGPPSVHSGVPAAARGADFHPLAGVSQAPQGRQLVSRQATEFRNSHRCRQRPGQAPLRRRSSGARNRTAKPGWLAEVDHWRRRRLRKMRYWHAPPDVLESEMRKNSRAYGMPRRRNSPERARKREEKLAALMKKVRPILDRYREATP